MEEGREGRKESGEEREKERGRERERERERERLSYDFLIKHTLVRPHCISTQPLLYLDTSASLSTAVLVTSLMSLDTEGHGGVGGYKPVNPNLVELEPSLWAGLK